MVSSVSIKKCVLLSGESFPDAALYICWESVAIYWGSWFLALWRNTRWSIRGGIFGRSFGFYLVTEVHWNKEGGKEEEKECNPSTVFHPSFVPWNCISPISLLFSRFYMHPFDYGFIFQTLACNNKDKIWYKLQFKKREILIEIFSLDSINYFSAFHGNFCMWSWALRS